MQATQWFSAGRLKKIMAVTLAVLILPAVPVAALTWNSAWTTNFGTKGTVTVTATNDTAGAVGPSTLNVNWGTTGGISAKGSKFKANRSFSLGAGENRLRYVNSIRSSFLNNGDVSVKVKVRGNIITVSGKINGNYEQASPSTITVSGAA